MNQSKIDSTHSPCIIAVTGPMAAGKNLAAQILQEEGCAVIDADIIAHEALETCKEAVLARFATDAEAMHLVLQNNDGTIHRKNLAKIVFSSTEKLTDHEALIHPEVNRRIEQFLENNKSSICILNATVLYKVPVIKRCAFVIYVDAPYLLRLFRACKRDRQRASRIIQRFSLQKDLYAQYQKKNVDIYKVQNFGKPEHLRKKLVRILNNRCKFDVKYNSMNPLN